MISETNDTLNERQLYLTILTIYITDQNNGHKNNYTTHKIELTRPTLER